MHDTCGSCLTCGILVIVRCILKNLNLLKPECIPNAYGSVLSNSNDLLLVIVYEDVYDFTLMRYNAPHNTECIGVKKYELPFSTSSCHYA